MKKMFLAIAIVAVAAIAFAFTTAGAKSEKKLAGYYRFTLNNPAMSNTAGYVSNPSNWSTDLVEVDEDDLQCSPGNYQACEIIAPIADVDAGTHKLKGTITETAGSSSFNVIDSYTPTTGSASFNNRTP